MYSFYNIVCANTLCAYVYDERTNFNFLIKISREVLLEVFLSIKLNCLSYEKESLARSTSQIYVTVTKIYHFESKDIRLKSL